MDRRLKLHQILKNILGTNNVYFQPPSNTKIQYPAIIYNRSDIESTYADNHTYRNTIKYDLTLIGRSPENEKIEQILNLPYCSYDRFYISDGLNHDSFSIYY